MNITDKGSVKNSIFINPAVRSKCEAFFADVVKAQNCGKAKTCCLVITHFLAERPFYLNALNETSAIAKVFAKPKSLIRRIWDEVEKLYPVDVADRVRLGDPGYLETQIDSAIPDDAFLLMDLGGYFADAGPALRDRYGARFLGVVEDTENGHKRHLSGSAAYPVFSAARSPLKASEDFLIGQSIVFSLEALLREWGAILQGRSVCVIGYGKLGQSAAQLIKQRGSNVRVYDIDPVKLVLAKAHGFVVSSSLRASIACVDTVICATGNRSLDTQTISWLMPDCIVATVTSSDDELRLDGIDDYYKRETLTEHIARYSNAQHSFVLLNNGHAVNFIHGASVGYYIFPVQAELIASAAALVRGEGRPGLCEIQDVERRRIGNIWLDHFKQG